MLDRVLDERLQNQPWDLGVERFRIDLVADRQPILEADLFDLEILLQELELLLKRHGRCAGTVEGKAEEIAEAADHAIGGIRIRMHERRDRVQRVEEEMWVEFSLQRLQLCLHQLRLERGFLDGARPVTLAGNPSRSSVR